MFSFYVCAAVYAHFVVAGLSLLLSVYERTLWGQFNVQSACLLYLLSVCMHTLWWQVSATPLGASVSWP